MNKSRDHHEMEKRRLRAAHLFEKGYSSAEVARRLGVARQVSHRWKQAWESGGKAALASKGQAGRKSKMDAAAGQRVVEALLRGPKAQGYKTELWTLPRVSALIDKVAGVRYHAGHVWRVRGALGFSCQRPERRALERDEKAVGTWQRKTWPTLKKTPNASGASSSSWTRADGAPSPLAPETWAPRGQTPLLHESFNWKSLSIVGGITLKRFYFQLHKGSIKGRRSWSLSNTCSATSKRAS